MNPIASKFAELKKSGKKAFIPYIMGGDPGLKETIQLIELLNETGADLIEVGVPFSDPVADGPVIQQAAVRSLQNGCTLTKLLQKLKDVKGNFDTPINLMIYYNMIFQRGVPKFLEEIKEVGCSGLIIPDLPPDEAEGITNLASRFEIGLNFLVAPTSSEDRIKLVTTASTGFVYAVSLKGVTGVRNNLPPQLPDFINRIKNLTEKPVAVGFGIATPEQAKMVASISDGVIVGSAIVKAIAEDSSFKIIKNCVRELSLAIHN